MAQRSAASALRARTKSCIELTDDDTFYVTDRGLKLQPGDRCVKVRGWEKGQHGPVGRLGERYVRCLRLHDEQIAGKQGCSSNK